MQLSKITFPLYKIRSYLNIEENKLGIVKITSLHGIYILDDKTLSGTFEERRLALYNKYKNSEIYPLYERVIYLRQLVKYRSGSIFIDHNGNIIKYKKSSKLFDIKAHKIKNIKKYADNWSIVKVDGIEIPFIVADLLEHKVKYVSIMHTKHGPFLYDLTSEWHEPYKRKI